MTYLSQINFSSYNKIPKINTVCPNQPYAKIHTCQHTRQTIARRICHTCAYNMYFNGILDKALSIYQFGNFCQTKINEINMPRSYKFQISMVLILHIKIFPLIFFFGKNLPINLIYKLYQIIWLPNKKEYILIW